MADCASTLRVTEQPNPLSRDIDVVSTPDAIGILRACDRQLFEERSFADLPGTLSPVQLENAAVASRMLQKVLQRDPVVAPATASCSGGVAAAHDCGLIVISGSGTSGRLAFLVALEFNRLLRARGLYPCFRHLIAGGDTALLKSVESAEDTSAEAVRDLRQLIATNDVPVRHVVYIGVTCGLSATYVGAQLEFCMQQQQRQQQANEGQQPSGPVDAAAGDEGGLGDVVDAGVVFHAILLGFNPVGSARPLRIANWASTFQSVARDLQALALRDPLAAAIVNPCVGPEAICGSTRMKGGSATKFLLEAMAGVALEQFCAGGSASAAAVKAALEQYHATAERTYESLLCPRPANGGMGDEPEARTGSFAAVVDAACAALRQPEGRVVYLGRGHKGILGLVDASECPPTYNARFEDIRGYVQGGWPALYYGLDTPTAGGSAHVGEGPVFAERIPISIASFFAEASVDGARPFLPTDLVVVLDTCPRSHPQATGTGRAVPLSFAHTAVAQVKAAGLQCQLAVLAVHADDAAAHTAVAHIEVPLRASVALPRLDLLSTAGTSSDPIDGAGTAGDGLLGDFALKLMLNALSTTAHVQKGTVFTNRMVNLRVSNVKLFHRAVAMVAQLGDRPTSAARDALLQAIYSIDRVPTTLIEADTGEHVRASTKHHTSLVPLALLLLLARTQDDDGAAAAVVGSAVSSIEAARAQLAATPVLRVLLDKVLRRDAAASPP